MGDASEKLRILAIDDSIVNLKLLTVILVREGFDVLTTDDSMEAVPLALDYKPQLILLDIMMPELSGLEILSLLKQNNVTQSVPVLMVTARASGVDVRTALEAGAFDYMRKPLDEVEVIARVRSALRYKQHQDKLTEMATRDSLTGLYNHALLVDLLTRELAGARRKNLPVAFGMADIDHFKQVNDRYGHQAGDTVLIEVSRILAEGLRKSDPVGRYGGEEFGIVLGDCSRERAVVLCERLRQLVEEAIIVYAGQRIKVTISLGLAFVNPGEQTTEAEMVHRADIALYQAKEAGRNRLVSSTT